ncbi:hypothetical protein [Cellulomonas triticagri]|uniref:Lipoprotein n=1 Tax=Cellulomonas triticagri TaxID=2483352 RepID=A0A3M2JQI5_9CELL|nr:hypothetical protein [Cellulomonas triticagri]RMI14080.1 hypothetical protein EBM89_01790 [Cellulomonas triticagri]
MRSASATALVTLSALAPVALAGCTQVGGPDDVDAPPTSSAREAPAAPSAPLTEADLEMLMMVDATPEGMTWLASPPATWTALPSSTGTSSWQVADSRCQVSLTRLQGYGSKETPTASEVVHDIVRRGAAALGTEVDFAPAGLLGVPAVLAHTPEGVIFEMGFARTRFADASGLLQGDAIGFRDGGDLALTAHVMCGDGEYEEHRDELLRFLTTQVRIELRFAGPGG